MHNYDFNCRSCNANFSLTYQSFSAYETAKSHCCIHCNSDKTIRRIGRVALVKGGNRRLDELSNDANVDETDPKSMGDFVKQLGQELDTKISDETEH